MRLNQWGTIAKDAWKHFGERYYPDVEAHESVVMPSHVHGIIRLKTGNELPLGQIVRSYKSEVTREIRRLAGMSKAVIWQKNYHEVIIHGLDELKARVAYIKENPLRWSLKREVERGIIAETTSPLKGMSYVGNLDLLQSSKLLLLRISRSAGELEVAEWQRRVAVFRGNVVSSFMSPGERACLEVLLTKHQRGAATCGVIWVLPYGISEQIVGAWGAAFLEGQALWLSKYGGEVRGVSRERCLECNEIAGEIVRYPQQVEALPGGRDDGAFPGGCDDGALPGGRDDGALPSGRDDGGSLARGCPDLSGV